MANQKIIEKLLQKYFMTSSEHMFDILYNVTYPIFIKYARGKCTLSNNNDPEEIVNRLYLILILRTIKKNKIPIRNMISWGFGAINRLIKKDKHNLGRKSIIYLSESMKAQCLTPEFCTKS